MNGTDEDLMGFSVCVVILNWNKADMTIRCLESLRDATANCNVTVLVVDNGSEARDIDLLRTQRDLYDVLLQNGENLGFANGVNRGIESILSTETFDLWCLLNNDCVLTDSQLFTKSIVAFKTDHQLGILGPKITFWPDTSRVWSVGGYVHPWSGERHIGHGEIDQGQYTGRLSRRFVSGACLFIRDTTLRQVDFVPAAYFFGKEEWELSLRARRLGWLVQVDMDMTIGHEASSSHSANDPVYIFNGTASKTLYRKRNHPRTAFLLWAALYSVYLWFMLPTIYRVAPQRFQLGVTWPQFIHAHRAGFMTGLRSERITAVDLQRFRAELN